MQGLGINFTYLLLMFLTLLVILAVVVGAALLIVGLLRRVGKRPLPQAGSTLVMEADVTADGVFIPRALLGDASQVEIRQRDGVLLLVPRPQAGTAAQRGET